MEATAAPDHASHNAAATPPVDTTDEAGWVRAVLGGDRHAFRHLVERYEGPVFRALLGTLRSREDAEDLTQEVFLQAFRRLADFDCTRPMGPWLMRIAHNMAASRLRRPGVVLLSDPDGASAEVPAPGPCARTRMENDQRRDAVFRALGTMPVESRRDLELFYHDELPVAEIAQLTGRREGAVRTALHRARETLRELLRTGKGHGQ